MIANGCVSSAWPNAAVHQTLHCALQIDSSRTPILVKAADKLLSDATLKGLLLEMQTFARENPWCEDSAVFYSLCYHNEATKHKAWWTWEGPLR